MKKLIKKILFKEQPDGSYKIVRGPGKGLKMIIDISNKAQRVLGLDEKEIMNDFVNLSKKCNNFIDIGASDGYYGLMYHNINKKGNIFLFEAQEVFKEEQEKNFQLNGFPTNYFHSSKFVSNINDENNITIDSVFTKKNETIFFKIDVDGGEVDVLNGLSSVIKNNNCYFIIETHSLQLEKDCISYLNANNLKHQIIDNAVWRSILPEQRIIEHNRWLVASPN